MKNHKLNYFALLVVLFVIIRCSLCFQLEADEISLHSQIAYFSVRSLNGCAFDLTAFEDHKMYFIFFMAKQCPVCDNNLYWWNKLSRFFSQSALKIGVVVSENSPSEISRAVISKRIDFEIYTPQDNIAFKKYFKIEENESQLLILKGRKIVFIKRGDITANDYFAIKKTFYKGE